MSQDLRLCLFLLLFPPNQPLLSPSSLSLSLPSRLAKRRVVVAYVTYTNTKKRLFTCIMPGTSANQGTQKQCAPVSSSSSSSMHSFPPCNKLMKPFPPLHPSSLLHSPFSFFFPSSCLFAPSPPPPPFMVNSYKSEARGGKGKPPSPRLYMHTVLKLFTLHYASSVSKWDKKGALWFLYS